MLVFDYDVLDNNLLKTFGEITWKYKIDELTDKLLDSLNRLINRNDLVRTTKLTNELLKILKVICTSCKDKEIEGSDLKSLNEIENSLPTLKKEQEQERSYTIDKLNKELVKTHDKLNRKILLCKSCKEKEVKKLTDKCGNKK